MFGHAPDATVADAEAAVAAARRAFDKSDWSTNTELRVRCLEQLHQALVDHRDELAALTIAEVGATAGAVPGRAARRPIEIVRYYADLLKTYPMTEDLGNIESRGMQHHRWVEKEAGGVVAAIIAYNYPNQLALAKLAPALAAGCTVVLKSAPDTPLITLALGELIANHTDIPAGVVNVLSGADPEVGAVLTTSPDVDMVTFTGSTPTGRRIMAAASETLKNVFLELGGKSAAIVLDDADFNTAALFSAFSMVTHAGQGCALTSRLLVPRKHHDEIVEMVKNNFGLVRYGDPADPKTYMGPLISEKQRDKVDGMVKRAVEAGATLVTGGEKVDPGLLLYPDAVRRCRPRQRDRPGRGLRPGTRRHRLRRRRRRGADRQQLHLRAVRRGVRQRGARAGGGPPHPHRHLLHQRRQLLQPRQSVRRVQAVRHRPRDGQAGLEEFLEAKTFACGGAHEQAAGRAFASSRSRCTASCPRRAPCCANGAPTSSRSSTPSPATRSAGCARPDCCGSRATPTPTSSTPTAASAASGWTCRCPRAKRCCSNWRKRADVFLTSFLPGHRQKFGIDVDDIRAVNPKIIYARGSALGPRGEESVKGGYDMTAFWCRAGTAATITPPGTPGMVGPPGPAYGDTISGTNLAGGIAAALLKRERTGEPSVVDVSLLGSGLWSMGHTVALTKHLGQLMEAFPPGVHGSPINPLVGLYATADDRYISFVMMQPTKFWADVCRHMDLDELADDPRFATAESIAENTAAAAEILNERWPSGPLPEWSERFATLAGPWAPVQDTLQAAEDAQIRANEYMVQAGELELVANPVQFDVSAPQTGPRPGSRSKLTKSCWNSDLDWDRIIELKTAGAVT